MDKLWHVCVAVAVLAAACGPTPTLTDATVMPTFDSGARDRSAADGEGADGLRVDSARADVESEDSAAPDAALDATTGVEGGMRDRSAVDVRNTDVSAPDLAHPDLPRADRAAPDLTRPDNSLPDNAPNYGPYLAPNLPGSINDNASTLAVIEVAQALSVYGVNVHVELTHNRLSDLTIRLEPPMGVAVELFNGDSCSSEPCVSPMTIDRLITPLANTQGTWVLRVVDDAPSQTGTLSLFMLSFVP